MTRDPRRDALRTATEAYVTDVLALSARAPWAKAPRTFLSLLEVLDPLDIAELDAACRRQLLGIRAEQPIGPERLARLMPRLAQRPEVAPLLALDRNGHVRMAAVEAWEDAPPFPMALVLLVRSNDWVPEIRDRARAHLLPALERLEPDEIDRLIPVLLDRMPEWRRGDPDATPVRRLLAHPALHAAALRRVRDDTSGPLARRLRFLLREAGYDHHLPHLAAGARSGAVRAVALEVLLTGVTHWTDGWTWTWTDKSMGLSLRERRRHSRSLGPPAADPGSLLAAAASDRSPIVRRVVADALIRLGPVLPEPTLEALRQDRSTPVAGRLAFFDRKWRAGAADPTTLKLRTK